MAASTGPDGSTSVLGALPNPFQRRHIRKHQAAGPRMRRRPEAAEPTAVSRARSTSISGLMQQPHIRPRSGRSVEQRDCADSPILLARWRTLSGSRSDSICACSCGGILLLSAASHANFKGRDGLIGLVGLFGGDGLVRAVYRRGPQGAELGRSRTRPAVGRRRQRHRLEVSGRHRWRTRRSPGRRSCPRACRPGAAR